MQGQRAKGYKAQTVRQTVARWIEQGRFTRGQQLPSERALAEELGVNHLTVRRGLADLVREGVIVRQAGVGSFVNVGQAEPTRLGLAIPQGLFRVESHSAPSQILQGIHEVVDPREYSVQTLPYGPGQLWEQVGQIAVSSGLRGLIVAPDWQVTHHDLERLVGAGLEVVLLNPHMTQMGCGLSWAGVDAVGPTIQIMSRLLGLGHRRIAVVHYERSHSKVEELSAIRMLLAHESSPSVEVVFVELPNAEVLDCGPLKQLLAGDLDELPTAMLVPDESIASHVFQLCYQQRIDIPGWMSLASIANYAPLSMSVRLASPDSMTQRVLASQAAARRLVGQLAEGGEPETQAIMMLPAQVHWGDSIARPRDLSLSGSDAQDKARQSAVEALAVPTS